MQGVGAGFDCEVGEADFVGVAVDDCSVGEDGGLVMVLVGLYGLGAGVGWSGRRAL